MADNNTPNQPYEPEAHQILQEDRYLWMARAFVVMVVLAAICDIILLVALANVTPVLRVQPFFLETQNKDQQIISINRPDIKVLDSVALKESLVRQYLMSRYGVGSDLNELTTRWGIDGPVFWMSEQTIFDEFLDKEAKKILPVARSDNFTREVNINTVKLVNPGNAGGYDVWQAILEFKDMDRVSTKPTVQTYQADLGTMFRAREGMTWKNRLKNPLGFTVMDFGLKKIGQEKTQK